VSWNDLITPRKASNDATTMAARGIKSPRRRRGLASGGAAGTQARKARTSLTPPLPSPLNSVSSFRAFAILSQDILLPLYSSLRRHLEHFVFQQASAALVIVLPSAHSFLSTDGVTSFDGFLSLMPSIPTLDHPRLSCLCHPPNRQNPSADF
jgi:hypothetical protein